MHQDQPIPFNRAAIEGDELDYIQQALERGHTSSGGEFAKRAEEILLAEFSAQEVLLTTSCTSALELSALMLDLQPGDTVIVPSFTFTTTALAFARQGAKIKFCDIEPGTLGLDPEHLRVAARRHGPRGRAGALRRRRVRHRRACARRSSTGRTSR